MKGLFTLLRIVLIAGIVLLPAVARAQLASPGKLSSAHKDLEGMGSCTKCHNFGEQTFRNNCLACHEEIKKRVDEKHGYHFYTRKLECSKCHKEHHGREFDLIRWNPDKFDHKQTGFELTGKHGGLKCGKCHTPQNITAADIKKKSKRIRERTFLGMTTACDNCHEDEHRGQFRGECNSCHTPAGWERQTFNHASARFKLTGQHASVDCNRCHPVQQDSKTIHGDNAFLKFRGVAFAQCSDCHKDHHNGSFGATCSSCHNPTGWKNLKLEASNFDHSKTHFPLEGKHAAVQCVQCHKGGDFARFKQADLGQCKTCHTDYHQAQFADRAGKGECAECHTVEGFIPARFSIEQHNLSRFTLKGAHAAIPCEKCHATAEIQGAQSKRFSWDVLKCSTCHQDPHAGQFNERIEKDDCAGCHNTESWFWMEFDHAQTDFPLVGRHQSVLCGKCHTESNINGITAKRFVFQSTQCSDCHNDEHQGQFADAAGKTACSRCHSPYDWKNLTFDHNALASFPLTGKHAGLECNRCHKPEAVQPGNPLTIKYKPLGTQCSACHASGD